MTIEQLEQWAFTHSHPDLWWISIDGGDVHGPVTLSALAKLMQKYSVIAVMNDSQRELENPVWATLCPALPSSPVADTEAKTVTKITSGQSGCAWMVFGIIMCMLWGMWGWPGLPKSNGVPGEREQSKMAYVMSQTFLEKYLQAPRSAKYPASASGGVVKNGNAYMVLSWVDAQNSFGALLRREYSARLLYLGGDQWRCTHLILDGEILISGE